MKRLLVISFVTFLGSSAFCQIAQLQSLFSSGGGSNQSGQFSNVSVVGEFAVSSFASGSYSGNFGYLNMQDSVIYDTVSIEQLSKVNSFNLFPNPNQGVFIISIAEVIDAEITIGVFTTLGQSVYSKTFQLGSFSKQQEIVVPNLSKGVYLIQLLANERSLYKKLIID